jgi:hypothetical protein
LPRMDITDLSLHLSRNVELICFDSLVKLRGAHAQAEEYCCLDL